MTNTISTSNSPISATLLDFNAISWIFYRRYEAVYSSMATVLHNMNHYFMCLLTSTRILTPYRNKSILLLLVVLHTISPLLVMMTKHYTVFVVGLLNVWLALVLGVSSGGAYPLCKL